MGADAHAVRLALARHLPAGSAVCVAYSGGRDSTVLLHAVAGLSHSLRLEARAVHVDHGLQPDARDWARHCAATAHALSVPCDTVAVAVRDVHGKGLEAAARDARYDALRASLRPGEYLVTAHHADDQLETVLLHLMRGSGVAGLAGIPREARFGPGRLCRPLLDVTGEALAAYARDCLTPAEITWLVDPMNADRGFDRAFLRHEVVPLLRRRFPAAALAASRSAALAAESALLLDELARADAQLAVDGYRVALRVFNTLGDARQRNLLRFVARERGWAPPPERRLREGLAQLLSAPPGRHPVLGWGGHEIRRYREHLHLLDAAVPAASGTTAPWPPGRALDLGPARGELALREAGAGLARDVVAGGLEVTFRSGGERVRPDADRHHRTLKYLFQSRGVVPWMRGHVPLVLSGGRLAAVGDLWVADWARAAPGERALRVEWRRHPPLS
jgi:tRNA(Ile)-lysidine synthase